MKMETKKNCVSPLPTSVGSTLGHCMISRPAACLVFFTYLYRLSPARFKYGNMVDTCFNLLKLDIVSELKLVCSCEQDTIQIVLKDWLLYNPLLKVKSDFNIILYYDHSNVNTLSNRVS